MWQTPFASGGKFSLAQPGWNSNKLINNKDGQQLQDLFCFTNGFQNGRVFPSKELSHGSKGTGVPSHTIRTSSRGSKRVDVLSSQKIRMPTLGHVNDNSFSIKEEPNAIPPTGDLLSHLVRLEQQVSWLNARFEQHVILNQEEQCLLGNFNNAFDDISLFLHDAEDILKQPDSSETSNETVLFDNLQRLKDLCEKFQKKEDTLDELNTLGYRLALPEKVAMRLHDLNHTWQTKNTESDRRYKNVQELYWMRRKIPDEDFPLSFLLTQTEHDLEDLAEEIKGNLVELKHQKEECEKSWVLIHPYEDFPGLEEVVSKEYYHANLQTQTQKLHQHSMTLQRHHQQNHCPSRKELPVYEEFITMEHSHTSLHSARQTLLEQRFTPEKQHQQNCSKVQVHGSHVDTSNKCSKEGQLIPAYQNNNWTLSTFVTSGFRSFLAAALRFLSSRMAFFLGLGLTGGAYIGPGTFLNYGGILENTFSRNLVRHLRRQTPV